jgi:hypothetical protein
MVGSSALAPKDLGLHTSPCTVNEEDMSAPRPLLLNLQAINEPQQKVETTARCTAPSHNHAVISTHSFSPFLPHSLAVIHIDSPSLLVSPPLCRQQ